MRMPRSTGSVLSIAMVAGLCSLMSCNALDRASVATDSCDDIEDEAVGISKGELVKISHGHLLRRSKTEVVCEGDGFYSTDQYARTIYQERIDDEGDVLIEYRPADAAEATAPNNPASDMSDSPDNDESSRDTE